MSSVSYLGFPRSIVAALKKVQPFVPKLLRQLAVVAVTDAEMRRLNRQFRHKNKTTDVLTFVYDAHHADIYISLAVARRQARARKVTLAQECQRLLVHGVCHALGMDHHTVSDFKTMRKTEFEVFIQCVTV